MKRILLLLFFITSLSTNLCAQWLQNGLIGKEIHSLAVKGSYLFAGTHFEGIFLSTDSGNTWAPTNYGNPCGGMVLSFGIGDTTVYVSANNDILQSTNNGAYWTGISASIVAGVNYLGEINSIFPVTNGLFYSSVFQEGYLSTNNGINWTSISHGLPCLNCMIHSLTVIGNRVLIGTDNSTSFSVTGGAFFSIDSGATWTGSGLSRDVFSVLTFGSIVFAGTENGLFVSSDSGSTWLPSGFSGHRVDRLIADGDNIFASSFGNIYLSRDSGVSWLNIGLVPYYVTSLAVLGPYLFAGTLQIGNAIQGVWRTTIPNILLSSMTIGGQNLENVSLYPIPSGDKITIESARPIRYYKLYDFSGKLLLDNEVASSKFELDLSRFKAGIYLLTLCDEENQIHRKIIKQ